MVILMVGGGIIMAVVGVVLIVLAQFILGVILIFSGIVTAVVGFAVRPLMASAREIAEQNGTKMNRFGTPSLSSSLESANDRVHAAQQNMSQLWGTANPVAKSGSPGEAMVKSATDTGEKHNMNPVYSLGLLVTPEGQRTYEVSMTSEVNSLAIAQCVPGSKVPIKVNPEDPQDVWVDWLAIAGKGGV